MRLCTHCKQMKPESEFYPKGDGLQSWCKDCCREHGRLRNGTTGEYRTPIHKETQVRPLPLFNNQNQSNMNYVTENITPAKAQQYLQTSEGNRPISKPTVHSYADTMKKGGWLLNGMCIIFDSEGHLIDGHHRLLGVIEAGTPVRFDVCRGITADAFTTYDCGRHRTIGQLLAMQGTKHYNLVGSIVSANEMLVKRGKLQANTARGGHVGQGKQTNAEKYEQYRRDPEGFDATAVVIVRLLSRCRIMQGSWAGGIYYYLTHTGGYTEAEVLPFFEALFSVDTSDIAVADMLRKAITKATMSGKKLQPEMLWALTAKAWNYYVDGVTPKILRYQMNTEELPSLKTKE